MNSTSQAHRKILITGGGGFVGQWLSRAVLSRGDEVWLAGLGFLPEKPAVLSRAERKAVRWISADIRSDSDLSNLFQACVPDLVVHLAGVSFVPNAERVPASAYEINVVGSVRMLSVLAEKKAAGQLDPIILVVGGTQYGAHPNADMPLRETAEQRPASVYAVTKAAQEIAALQFARASGLGVIRTRSFSHSGAGHAAEFLLPSLANRVRELASAPGSVRIGNDVIRDYLHVDDVVLAYLVLLDHGVPGEVYNVCSGVGVSVNELAATAISLAGAKADVLSDPALKRASDVPVLIGSPEKLRKATEWRPTKTYRDIFEDLLATT